MSDERTLTIHETARLIAATVKKQCAVEAVNTHRQALANAENTARLAQFEMQELMSELGIGEGDSFDMKTGIVKAA